MAKSDIYAIWLQLRCKTASPLVRPLYKLFGSAEAIYNADDYSQLQTRVSPEKIDKLHDKELFEAERILRVCRARGIRLITRDAGNFPSQLTWIKNPPAVLYCVGRETDLENMSGVALVGSRRASQYGRECAGRYASALAKEGAVIISGMARGIDAAAHRGALAAGGFTVAVLGTAIDRPYPAENIPLYDEIIKKGCVISEIYPGGTSTKWDFAERNRIISGLSRVVLIGEAGEASGALITARDASEQGRRIFCLPSLPGDASSGTRRMVADGYTMINDAETVLRELQTLCGVKRPEPTVSPSIIRICEKPEQAEPAKSEARHGEYGECANRILTLLAEKGELTTSQLIRLLGVTAMDVMSSLTALELAGEIKSLPGDRYMIKK